jgi:hypothetical protein
MDQVDYDRWWPLHLKTSRGEQLSDADRQSYAEGLVQLQREEDLSGDLAAVEAARRTVADLQRLQISLRSTLHAQTEYLKRLQSIIGLHRE